MNIDDRGYSVLSILCEGAQQLFGLGIATTNTILRYQVSDRAGLRFYDKKNFYLSTRRRPKSHATMGSTLIAEPHNFKPTRFQSIY
ncbi:hypothetical protein M622_08995 [Thauera terpenica 58Eu]|uniref:Uncharacterized protein n=1 Tax=Thauera terpenica 58Eu TaxID=1348657 RepID=S9ZU99_9RHOO|nr:hypothetical protein M622_08995 [Thauera terpenica 58Eu]